MRKTTLTLARTVMTLLLTMITATGAWADMPADGSAENPYIINNATDWATFAADINAGNNLYACYKLADDFDNSSSPVSVMVGSQDNPFRGTFDGNGKTLYVNIESDEEGAAPFHHVYAVTIKNLTVAGTITSTAKYAGGMVGLLDGTNNTRDQNDIIDCVVTATITSSASYIGGFIGNANAGSYTISSFTNCVFAGTISYNGTGEPYDVGAFFGYGHANDNFTNCLEIGHYNNIPEVSPRGGYSTGAHATSLYYVNKIGNPSRINEEYGCFQVLATAPARDMYLARTIKGYTCYQPATLTGLMDKYAYNEGNAVSLGYALWLGKTAMEENTDYTVTIKNSSNAVVAPAELKAIGTYTITFTPISGHASGCVSQTVRSFEIMEGESLDGYVFSKDGDNYLIKNEADLERLAAYVNSGHTAEGLTFKLDVENGITMTAEHTAIGNRSCRFKGTFNGNNKTISNLTVNKPYETYQGLFGYLGGTAVIQDLTLIDCHITGNHSTGGIVGRAEGTSADASIQISNCHLENGAFAITRPDVNSIGGIVGYAQNTKITGCTVTGEISTANNSAYVGGIVGMAYGNVIVTSCENAANINATKYCGGIVGFENYSSNRFTDCFNTGVIEGGSYLGGIVGDYYNNNDYSNCYYAYPCTTGALEGYDSDGKGARAYLIKAGDHIASINIADEATVTSKISGTKYYKKGDWTLTLGLETNYTFIKYTCEGGTLTDLETADGTHTLTINRNDVTISAIASSNSGVAMTDVTIENIPDKRWRGTEAIVPELNVSYGGKDLVLGTDYLVEGTNNNAIGTATLTLTGVNDYKGTTTKDFNIVDFPLLDPENTTNSSTNPWLIANEEDLEALACIVNTNQRRDGYYLQTNNITLKKEHTAIGTRIDLGNYDYNEYYFEGTYDGGNNNTISGLKINKPSEKYQGLFGDIYKATIKNVVIVDCDITGADYTGGVAGYAFGSYYTYSVIKNCSVSGEIKVEGNNKHYHGGIVGTINRATVEGCVNSATVSCNVDAEGYGGIAGYMSRDESKIKDCFNAGVVTGRKYVGSIVGKKLAGTLSNNYHSVETTGGVGAGDAATGTDQEGTGIAATITLGDRVSFVEQPVAFAKVGDVNYYKNGTEVKLAYEVPENKYFDCYSVNSGEISNAGLINGTHTLTGFTENLVITGNVVDTQTDIATATIEAIDDLTFNGQEQHPVPVVKLGDVTLKENTHYTISYDDDCTNVGEKTVTIHGIGRFNSTKNQVFNINPFDISGENVLTITGFVDYYAKTGSEVHPTPTSVTCAATNNATLALDTDYELSYSGGCILPGDYETILTGKGNYKGEKTVPFSILMMETPLTVVDDGNTYNNYVPVYGSNAENYQKTEFVMPKGDLTAMTGKAITAMQFYLSQTASRSWGDARFRVFMKEVENPTISSYSGTEGATIVYEGALDGTQAVMTVNFTTPYFYKGGNLLIGFYEYQKGTWASVAFSGKIIDGTSIGDYSSSLDDVTATQRNFLPKTTFSYGYMSSITFAPEGYATYYDSGYDVVLPAGMKARIVTEKGEGEGQLTYETIADGDTDNKVVPAATGVMLQVAESTEPQTRSIYLDSKTATAYSGTNFLHGSDTETETSGDGLHYKLTYSNNDDNFGWYWGATNGAAFTSPAHKAWLTLPATAARSFFGLPDYDDELTGIKDIEDSAIEGLRFDGAVYTLDGRKVVNSNSSNSKLPKGLYIVNGKKVVVK